MGRSVKLRHPGGILYSKSPTTSSLSLIPKFFESIGNFTLFTILLTLILTLSLSFNTLLLLTLGTYRIYRKLSSIRFSLPAPTLPSLHIPGPLILLTLISITIYLTYIYIDRHIVRTLPSPMLLTTRRPSLTTKIYDRHGTLLHKFYKDENRTLITYDKIPTHLKNAVIAIEDKDFYSHHGLSLKSLGRALLHNTRNQLRCRIAQTDCDFSLQGGSTITQQLVKNTLLTPEKTLTRKARELILAYQTEKLFTKDEILEMYLNEVPFGGSIYGVEEASQSFFGVSASELTLPQAALLAGLPASPTTYSPLGPHPELTKNRQVEVLERMYHSRLITRDELDSATIAPLSISPPPNPLLAPHFVMYVKEYLVSRYGEDRVDRGGLEVTTSLDLNIHNLTQNIVSQELGPLKALNISNAASLVTRPQTGEILAMVGSGDYFDLKNQGNFNVTTALRQPGSAIKPIMYSLALENGYTPATLIDDSPVTFLTPGSPPYSPKNYDNRFHGQVTVRTALASSYNIPAVKTLATLGVTRFIDHARKMGISTWNTPNRFGLSLTLGGGEVKMTDMALAYGTIANLGRRVDLHPVLKVTDSYGHIYEEYTCHPDPSTCPHTTVLNPGVAYQLADILSDNSARAPAFGTRSVLNIPNHKVSVKTGTSNNLKDNWTFGFTGNYLVATWVGNNDSRPATHLASGITGASPIWQKIIYNLIKDTPPVSPSPPPNLIAVEICLTTSSLSCPACPTKRTEYFLPGTEPRKSCNDEQFKPSPAQNPPLTLNQF